jgi:cytochrome c oxidase subunit 2
VQDTREGEVDLRALIALLFACGSPPPPSTPLPRIPDAAIDAAPDADTRLRDRGAQLFQDKGCIACHSLDGTFRIGPNLVGDWGTTVTLSDGSAVVVDEAYVRESIIDSLAKKRAGFVPVMPVFDGRVTPDELDALVVYIESLR